MIKVCKFGGSSLTSGEQFKKVKDIVKGDETRCVVLVSASRKAVRRGQQDN